MTMNWLPPCSGSPATAPVIHAGRCPACSTGRRASTTRTSTSRKDTTTLYASDRDVFLFLVDDLNPIEAGRLPDGSPDLYFRGFYCWNSEVGAKTLGIASFYLRAVCQNRNLWGVEDFEEITIRHSKYAASRFRPRGGPGADAFRKFLAHAVRQRHQDRAREASSPVLTTSEATSCASAASRSRRRRRSSRRCWPRRAASPRASSTSCRASQQLPGTSPIRMPGSISRRGRRSCSTEWPDAGRSSRRVFARTSSLRFCIRRRPPEEEGGARLRDGSGGPERGSRIARRGEMLMSKSIQKITLSSVA